MALSVYKEENLVMFEESMGARRVTLNRPKKLNSLNYEMVIQLLKKFQDYENDPTVKFVILKGNGRAFCAGGDVTALINFMTSGHWSFGANFFRKQYGLDYLLGTYKKPLVALIDGIVMGGGAGLSMHAAFRIVTENTIFAMPEAAIGVFPDVGSSHFLSELPGFFGEYLGLTGARLNGMEMLECGLATHFVLSKDLPLLEVALLMMPSSDVSNITRISRIVDEFVNEVNTKQENAYPRVRMEIINKCFSGKTVEDILLSSESFAAMKNEKWILDAIRSMKSASPLSLKLSLRLIREGRSQRLEQCLAREYLAISHVLRRTMNADFYEGSRAMLIDKDRKPQWRPSQLELVSEEMVGKCFSTIDDEEWEPIRLIARTNHDSSVIISRL